MTLKQYLTIMILGTLLCIATWITVLFNVDPFRDTGIGLLFFSLSFFLSLVGVISTLMFGIYYGISRGRAPMYRIVKKSFVVGLFLAGMITLLLYLRGIQLLNLWNLIIFVGIICFLFLFQLSLRLHNKEKAQL